jgi:hypothetical protein
MQHMTTHMHNPISPTTHTGPTAVRRSALGRWFAPLTWPSTWKETAALLLALPTSAVWFSVAVAGLFTSAAVMVTIIGVPLTVALLRCGRMIGAAERTVGRALLGTDLPPFPPVSKDGTWWHRVRRMLTDAPSWRGVAYAIVSLPVGVVMFTSTVVLWSVSAGATAFPVYQAFLSDSDIADVPDAFEPILHGWGRVGFVAGVALLGVVLLAMTPRLLHRLANVQSS